MYFGDLLPFTNVLLEALWTSIYITLASMIIGSLFGLFIYAGKQSRMAIANYPCVAFIEIIRNTPVLVQLYFVYFALPSLGINLNAIVAGIIALSMNNAAYCAEIYRAGFQAVPRGLHEAAMALALTRRDRFRYVSLIPAIRNVIPALTNQFILLFLASSVASIIALPELMHAVMEISANTFRTVEAIVVGACLYFGISWLLSRGSKYIETRLFRWKVS